MTLHCPARFLVVPAARLDDDALQRLRDERVAVVCSGPEHRTEAAASAEVLGCPVVELAGLDDTSRWSEELEGIADLHRGETVLVVGGAGSAVPSGVVEIGDDGARVLGAGTTVTTPDDHAEGSTPI